MNYNRRIEAIIFDLDGTLVSSSLNFQTIKQDIGCPADSDILNFVDKLSPAQHHMANETIMQHEMADATHAKALHGARSLLRFLQRQNIPTAIVTRNSRQAAEIKIEQCQFNISQLITREDALPKPNPQSLLSLSKHWDIAPQHIAYVGDYLYDVQAANNAGMQSVLLTFGSDKPYQNLADFCFDNLLHLHASLALSHTQQAHCQ
ncbi:HAD family hydrolase [Shewanella waksmanii]|uniref:HAD family hydrolase n=1 Tax=Shewanella waksmanii TaxID=213783 RepID=UPI003735488B